ncbi:MAG: hypothetical protein ABW298_10150 [Candidatus Binatia bacterium]
MNPVSQGSRDRGECSQTDSESDFRCLARVPAPLLAAFDGLILFYVAWCLLPSATWGSSTLRFPFGGKFEATLSRQHLYQFWVMLFIRQHVGARNHRPGILARGGTRLSPPFQSLVLFTATLTVFLTLQPRLGVSSGDTLGARLLPVSVLREGNLDLDEFYPGISSDHRYSVRKYAGHWYPEFPIFVGITATPIYAILSALLPESSSRWTSSYRLENQDAAQSFEQIAASIIATLSVVVVWGFIRAVSPPSMQSMSLWIAAAYGFGTPILSTASRALWMHGPSCLFLAGAALALFVKTDARNLMLLIAGCCLGWACANRPSNAVIVLCVLPWVMLAHGRKAFYVAVGLGSTLAIVFWVNASIYDTILGGYAVFASDFHSFSPAVFATILFSPSRGLFLFSPYLLFPLVLVIASIVRRGPWFPKLLVLAAVASAVTVACYASWSGGYSFGPRLLCEAALLLTLSLPFYVDRLALHPPAKSLFLVLVIISCHIHITGVRFGDGEWTGKIFHGKQEVGRFWNPEDSQLWWSLSGGDRRSIPVAP